MHRAVALIVVAMTSFAVAPTSAAGEPEPREGAVHRVPLYGVLVRPYDAPPNPYAAGHRGIDIASTVGSPVRASAGGVVSFAGTVVGNRTVTIDHAAGLQTSYSYLASIAVKKNDVVVGGAVVGTLGTGHDATLPAHVHLSARRDGVYLDPLSLYLGRSYADLVELVG